MDKNSARFEELEKLFKRSKFPAIILMGDQAGEKLWSLLRMSSPMLFEFPDRLIIDIMVSAVFWGADHVVIREEQTQDCFDGTVLFMRQKRDVISLFLLKVGRAPSYYVYATSDVYHEPYANWR